MKNDSERFAELLEKYVKGSSLSDFQEDMILEAAQNIRKLHSENKTMRLALEQAHSWMDGQARAQSKGCHSTFDLMMLRNERDELENILKSIGRSE